MTGGAGSRPEGHLNFLNEDVVLNGVSVYLTATQRAILRELVARGEAGISSQSLAANIRPGSPAQYRDTLKTHIWLLRRKLNELPFPRLEIVGGSGKSLYRLNWLAEPTDLS